MFCFCFGSLFSLQEQELGVPERKKEEGKAAFYVISFTCCDEAAKERMFDFDFDLFI